MGIEMTLEQRLNNDTQAMVLTAANFRFSPILSPCLTRIRYNIVSAKIAAYLKYNWSISSSTRPLTLSIISRLWNIKYLNATI